MINAHKMTKQPVRLEAVEKQRSLDEYTSAKVVDKASGVNTHMSTSAHGAFSGEPSVF